MERIGPDRSQREEAPRDDGAAFFAPVDHPLFRAVIEHLPVGIAVHSGGIVRYLNPCLRAMLGFAPAGEVTVTMLDLVHPDDREMARRRMTAVLRSRVATKNVEARLLHRDGSVRWVEVTAMPFELDGASASLATFRDIGERKNMEAQLMRVDRLASLGTLAVSVGHEINNPLTYMLGNLQLLGREVTRLVGVEDEARASLLGRLAVLEDGARRVHDIVRDLKLLSSGAAAADGPVDLSALLEVCAGMAEHEIRHRARLVRDYQASVRVRGSEARLGQVFLNLLVNAAQAIPEGDGDGHEVRISTRRADGDRVIVEVRDSGEGIAPEHRARIFEPFFTTKESTGTGLGLSISHTIVTALGGTIAAEPAEPRGTCFRVTLPCEPEAARPARDDGPAG